MRAGQPPRRPGVLGRRHRRDLGRRRQQRQDPAPVGLRRALRGPREVDNLYVVDTSFFPSIGAVNPALTAMANALRVADHLTHRLA
ncbi:GMC oxidoreductase [Nonomuraea sediminis]|uniref:GMC oxidoreductase n=1 Tax=Nonomuraea sediminis TaxID=2835864 RepID=UPI0035583A25